MKKNVSKQVLKVLKIFFKIIGSNEENECADICFEKYMKTQKEITKYFYEKQQKSN